MRKDIHLSEKLCWVAAMKNNFSASFAQLLVSLLIVIVILLISIFEFAVCRTGFWRLVLADYCRNFWFTRRGECLLFCRGGFRLGERLSRGGVFLGSAKEIFLPRLKVMWSRIFHVRT